MPNESTYNQPDWRPDTVINVAGDLNQGAPATPPAAPAAHIPYPRNQVFVGRDDELRRQRRTTSRIVMVSGANHLVVAPTKTTMIPWLFAEMLHVRSA